VQSKRGIPALDAILKYEFAKLQTFRGLLPFLAYVDGRPVVATAFSGWLRPLSHNAAAGRATGRYGRQRGTDLRR